MKRKTISQGEYPNQSAKLLMTHTAEVKDLLRVLLS